MFQGKCLNCGWRGKSTDCSSQWFELDEETSELLLICPMCKKGVVVELKSRRKEGAIPPTTLRSEVSLPNV